MTGPGSFRFVRYAWNDDEVKNLNPVGRLVYRSNILGSDQRITNTGGGNTSSKTREQDPLTRAAVDVLWVKGSGGDLRTSTKENFSSLYVEKVDDIRKLYDAHPVRGPKTPAEDEMVGMYPHCTFNLNPRAASIDTPLHAFVPHAHVDHMHPNAVIAIAAARRGEQLTKEIFGDDIMWLPWQRPGFDLGLRLRQLCHDFPRARGAILGQHGVINWADGDKECYGLTLDIIERASRFIEQHDKGPGTFGGEKYRSMDEAARKSTFIEILPWLRGRISQARRSIATTQDDAATLRFVNSIDATRLANLGTSCPDHFLRTKIKPLYVDWDSSKESTDALKKMLADGLEQYRKEYAAYFEHCKHADSPAMRDANPTVILVPGLGMIAWGKDKSESRVTAEFYTCAIDVMRGAEAIDEYVALPLQEAFDIEYWLLEEAKLKRMPPPKELSGRIICVVGAGSGIGRDAALRLSREGATLACADRRADDAAHTAGKITAIVGRGIGVAGSGLSDCGPAIALDVDITRRERVRECLENVILAYGGLDDVAVTAGIFVPPDRTGSISDETWALTFAINVTGAHIVSEEAAAIWRRQELPANLVLTTSVNAVVPKRGSLAYDTSKAAANHLVRELAVSLAPLIRVNGVAPATVIEGSSMFPRDRVIASLAKYKIPFDERITDDELRSLLAQYYASRTLTGLPVRSTDQSEAVFLLLSERLSRTTGHIITVDGGLADAFLR